jgi:oxygen-independent coproporphyrinogen III oxidase
LACRTSTRRCKRPSIAISPGPSRFAPVDALRQAGVASVNLDLMYGLPHQTVATIDETIAQVVKVEPDRIALFGYAHAPWMKPAQKLIPQDVLPDGDER